MYEHPTIMMMLGTQLNFMEVGAGRFHPGFPPAGGTLSDCGRCSRGGIASGLTAISSQSRPMVPVGRVRYENSIIASAMIFPWK